ncbi:LCP family protein [Neobacillus citreus]|uniref:LCP family protein n=1 Tax=Neobacillus citreus TaxID=2833578 RepID=A0A942T120_9BACI|nr:LCP family protein [Neobacillus citreus]MCH6266541.1 LCP family protein [Neobacillus citreus]
MSLYTRSNLKDAKKKRRKRIFMWIFLPILVLALSGAGYATFLIKKAESVVNKSYQPVKAASKREVKIDPEKDNISILLIGVDESKVRAKQYGSAVRTDALMVATLNKKEKSVTLLSIPRDSYVHIPEKNKYDKINHAHAFGGPALTIETVQELLDIPIDYYVKVNFYAFIDTVNALDGIEVDVPYEISEQDSQDRPNAIRLKPGLQTLNGEQALALARTRHKDSDIMRGQRQQQILKAIFKKAISVKSLTKHGKLIEAVGENMTTDMSFSNMKALMDYGMAGSGLTIETLALKGEDSYINKIYYYKLDKESLKETQNKLKEQLGLEPKVDNEIKDADQEKSDAQDN